MDKKSGIEKCGIYGKKLRKRLNLTQELLIKNGLVKGSDFIPGYREEEDKRKAKMTDKEREAYENES